MKNTNAKTNASENEQKPSLRLLVIGAHPADSFDNAGGACLHHARRGDTITSFIITGGARVHDEIISDYMRTRDSIPPADELRNLMNERIKVKQKEVFEACAIMGIHDVRFSTHDDSVVMLKEDLIQEIASLVREVRPHIVITHYPFDHGGMADHHAITGQSVVTALWSACSVEPGDPNPAWPVPQVFFFGFPGSFCRNNSLTTQFSPMNDIYVDVSDVIHLKRQALDKMRSQKYDGLMAEKRLEAVEGSAGFGAGVSYAEPFISYRASTHYTLPISDIQLDRAAETERVKFHRMSFIAAKHGTLDEFKKIPTPQPHF